MQVHDKLHFPKKCVPTFISLSRIFKTICFGFIVYRIFFEFHFKQDPILTDWPIEEFTQLITIKIFIYFSTTFSHFSFLHIKRPSETQCGSKPILQYTSTKDSSATIKAMDGWGFTSFRFPSQYTDTRPSSPRAVPAVPDVFAERLVGWSFPFFSTVQIISGRVSID